MGRFKDLAIQLINEINSQEQFEMPFFERRTPNLVFDWDTGHYYDANEDMPDEYYEDWEPDPNSDCDSVGEEEPEAELEKQVETIDSANAGLRVSETLLKNSAETK